MQPPILSLAERDRRWARVRHLMRERGFDGLLVAGFVANWLMRPVAEKYWLRAASSVPATRSAD